VEKIPSNGCLFLSVCDELRFIWKTAIKTAVDPRSGDGGNGGGGGGGVFKYVCAFTMLVG